MHVPDNLGWIRGIRTVHHSTGGPHRLSRDKRVKLMSNLTFPERTNRSCDCPEWIKAAITPVNRRLIFHIGERNRSCHWFFLRYEMSVYRKFWFEVFSRMRRARYAMPCKRLPTGVISC